MSDLSHYFPNLQPKEVREIQLYKPANTASKGMEGIIVFLLSSCSFNSFILEIWAVLHHCKKMDEVVFYMALIATVSD